MKGKLDAGKRVFLYFLLQGPAYFMGIHVALAPPPEKKLFFL
jgi:hypothetical protein